MIGMQLFLITMVLAVTGYVVNSFRNEFIQRFYNHEPNPYEFKNRAFYKLRKKWDK